MKKLTLSLITTIAMATSVMAEIHDTVIPYTGDGFYFGGAYGHMNQNDDWSGPMFDTNGISEPTRGNDEHDFSSFMLQAGYKINQYLALESRLWTVFGDIDYKSKNTVKDISHSIDSDGQNVWGIYVKPMYPVTDKLDIYSLLGYAYLDEDFLDESGFSWGLGASYSVTDNISVFADYIRLYNDTENETVSGYNADFGITVDTVNVGLSYKF